MRVAMEMAVTYGSSESPVEERFVHNFGVEMRS